MDEVTIYVVKYGKLLSHRIGVVLDSKTDRIIRVVADETFDALMIKEMSKFRSSFDDIGERFRHSDYLMTRALQEEFQEFRTCVIKELTDLPDMDWLNEEDKCKFFDWYGEMVMDAVAQKPGHFTVTETLGASIGHTKGLARIDFS